MKNIFQMGGAALLVATAIFSCTHDPFNFGEVIITENCSPDTAYFVNDVFPIINSNCAISGCHDAITSEEDIDLSSWDAIYYGGTIDPGNAGNSDLIEAITDDGDDRMPPDGELTSAQIDIIALWINQGALYNECIGDCDTTVVTYSGSIAPLLSANCIGCHSGTSPSGGVDLSSYANVVVAVENGTLYGAVNQDIGYVSMPPGTKLSDCKIDLIRIWIENGYPND
jgi:hypothetical protein